MPFKALIPDWNSLDAVRHVHSDFEAAAIAFFALLVLFDILAHLSEEGKGKTLLEKIGLGFFAVAVFAEIVAYPYGQRNDTLSAQIIGSLDTEAGKAFDKASKAHDLAQSASDIAKPAKEAADKAKGEADGAAKHAEEVDRSLLMTQYLISARQIRDPESLTKEFKQFAGLSISFRSPPSDPEAFSLCAGFVSVARGAGITVTDQCGQWFVFNGQTVTNIAVAGPDDKTMLALAKAVNDSGVFGGVASGPYGKAQHSPIYIVFVGQRSPFLIGQARPTPIKRTKLPKKQ